ncbi:MAG: hypothetical protein Q8M71_05505 [Thermodesulfovibrionales bacterium]|nr:hypothetical protein [Thermodesulfovibrionales bacterium]
MRKIMMLVFLLSFAMTMNWGSVAVAGQEEKCFGAIGNGCEGAGDKGLADWLLVPPGEKKPDGTVIQWVAIGSILHDNCCIDNPNGQHCKGYNVTQEGWSDDKPCVKEWRKAFYNSRDGRKWKATFGPYNEKNVSDNLTKAAARKTKLSDGLGNFKYDYAGKETVSTKKLAAPAGTSLDYSDVAFCASKKFQTYKDLLQFGKETDKHYTVGIGDWGVCQ